MTQPNKYLELKLTDAENQLLRQSDIDSIVQEVEQYSTNKDQQISEQLKALAECFMLVSEVQADPNKINKLREIING